MPLRLFGGQGGSRVRACPACEREIAADATFCPSCYMVIRPEGAAALREHLHGGRIPADVYLLRKMQAEDPNAGPVVRESPLVVPSPPSSPEPAVSQVPAHATPTPAPAPGPTPVAAAPQPPPLTPVHSLPTTPAESVTSETETAPPARVWRGAQSLLRFVPPLPPPTHTADEASALLTWMLERDPIIPNNLELLEEIHAGIFQKGPAAHLGYQPHLLIQIADDLVLHPNQETLDIHLGLLVTAYRRAAGAYHAAINKGEDEKNAALWQMASMASRLRVEAWVYRTRYGVAPSAPRPRRSRASRVSAD